ncbi:MAG: hypothetical protein HYV63_03110 [Candidatus Schekmanbacteria bacterium]|nr:hypothetical protein [Candidatus Schekmanbacteria bacterium]
MTHVPLFTRRLRRFILLAGSVVLISLTSAGCQVSPSGNDDSTEAQVPTNAIIATTSITNDVVTFDVNTYKTLGVDGAAYKDGWWHINLSFDLSLGAKINMDLQIQWKDRQGNVVQIPILGISELTVVHDISGSIQGTPIALAGSIKLINVDNSYLPKNLAISGRGDGNYGYSSLSYDVPDFRFDLDGKYPIGTLNALLSDPDLGKWTVNVIFDGTELVTISAITGEAAFELHLDLGCVCLTG